LTQNIGTNYTVTIPTLSDDASIVEAFKYYHTGALTGSIEENSIEYHITALGDQSDTIDTNLGYSGVSPTPSSVHARLNSLESTVGTSLASTYIKAIPSSNNTASTRNLIQPSTSSVIPLAIQGVVGQTADLQQWKTSAATVAKVTSEGAVYSYDGTSMAEVSTLSGVQTLTNKTLTNPISTIGTNTRTASYTLAISDQSKIIEYSSSSAGTITVPTNAVAAFPIGTYIVILQTGAAQATISGASGVTVNVTPGNKTRTQWSMATLIKRGTDSWVLAGDLVS
jgi:hypothetical protein